MTVSVSALLAGLGLTACSSSSTTSPPKADGAAPASAAPIAGQSAAPAKATAPVSGVTTESTGSGGSQTAKCRTQHLRWTLTRLADSGTGAKDPANAELVAVNSGSDSCTLAGYPKLAFHVGKGPEALGVGKGSPAPVTLGAGKKAVIALRYSELNGKGPDSGNCQVTASAADVTAPGDSTGVRVPVVDQNGKPAEITICGDEVRMSAPVAR
ncbi:DUF4232 domain-containing protein [Kitasatospora sp. HPMI-4]|uniref:DUF4232 domain-containing protein n=1 Tax=Kitasatospora sp. HPMI-4 TaxID=3448443 RepID=UPI003F1D3CFB